MSRPTLEVADIVRRTGNSFWEQKGPIPLPLQNLHPACWIKGAVEPRPS